MVINFFSAVAEYDFLKYALGACIFSGVISGLSGSFVVLKRMSNLVGGVSHAVLGGIGIAYYFHLNPILGAFLFAGFCAILIAIMKTRFKQNEDSFIGALWAFGMAIGILFLHLSPGYQVDLLTYLFGNVLMVSKVQLVSLMLTSVVLGGVIFLFYRHFLYVCMDEEWMKLRGVSPSWFYVFLLMLICLSIVMLIQVVGLVLVLAMMTIPATISKMMNKSSFEMIITSCVLAVLFSVFGLIIAYERNLPVSSAIILLASTIYFLVLLFSRINAAKFLPWINKN